MSLIPWNAAQSINTATAGVQSGPKVTQLADGNLVVTWQDSGSGNGDIKFQRFDSIGNKLGIETLAHTPPSFSESLSNITALSGGGFVVSWVETNFAVRAQKFSANGTPNGAMFSFSIPNYFEPGLTAPTHPPVVQALAGDAFAVFYTTFNFSGSSSVDLIGRIVNAAGVIGAAFNVATQTVGTQDAPQVALTAQGNIVVTWTDGGINQGDIKMASFTAAGSPLDPEFTVNSDTVSFQDHASVTRLSNGLHVVTWFTTNTDSSLDIHGQVVDYTGGRIGPEFLAGTTRIGSQNSSCVVALADGKFMVIYETNSETLRAQVFNGNGIPLGSEFLLTNTASEFATVPSAVTLADGRIAVTWSDYRFDGDGGIVMQILDPREGVFTGTANADTIHGHDGNVDFITGGDGLDTIHGLRGNDSLYGDAGNDQLFGGRGDDTMYGGLGVDTLIGGLGADDMDGGIGTDVVNYQASRVGVTVNLLNGFGFGGDAEGDTLFSIESIFGSNFNDTLTASNSAATFYGFVGVDTLTGGIGADSLIGGVGGDILNGAGGIDTAFYTGSSTAVTINLTNNALNAGGEAAGDQLSNIENIQGSALGDTITGNALANKLFGNGGNDRLNGGTGPDTLVGGTGSDSFVFASGGSGQTAATADVVSDYTKGAVGTGDEFDFTSNLAIGGVNFIDDNGTQANINNVTGVAIFDPDSGSGSTMADALSDIANSMTVGGNAVGEFAFFKVNQTGNFHLFISDGEAGVSANDVLVQLTGVTTINTINLMAGDLTILT